MLRTFYSIVPSIDYYYSTALNNSENNRYCLIINN